MRIDALREALAARPGQPVPFDELIDAVWGDDKPSNPKGALRNLVQRLRATDQVVTEPAGYRLVLRKPGPHQLPADLPDFVGRADEIEAALASTAPVLAITGPPGVGKTSLAVHVAHRLGEQFADGQLYVNLRAFSPGAPVTPEQAVSRFLRALGAEEVPVDLAEQTALYQRMTADRAVLVVIDNGTRELIGPLLPAGPSCRVIVTSRTDLPEHEQIRIGVFDHGEAQELLAHLRIGGSRTERAELARLCGHLPLALRIAAANVAYGHLPDYLTELRGDDRLDVLEIEGDAAVWATFDLSYRAQTEAAQRLFRLLGHVPGPDFGVAGATALLGEDATAELGRLVDANLVQRAGDRYSLHDLLRIFAMRLARPELGRLYDYYLVNADAAGRVLHPEFRRLKLPPVADAVPRHDFGDSTAAVAWLEAERASVVAAILAAGDRPVAWLLTDAMRAYFYFHSLLVDWVASAQAGLRAARALSDRAAEAAMRGSLGLAHWRGGQFAQAQAEFEEGIALARELGDEQVLGSLLINAGIVHWECGRLGAAADALRESLRIIGENPPAVYNLSGIYMDLGPLDLAVSYARDVARLSIEQGVSRGKAFAEGHLADAYILIGDVERAAEHLDALVPVLDDPALGTVFVIRMLDTRALLDLERGRSADAEAHANRSLELAVECEDPKSEGDAHNTLGLAAYAQGRVDEAVSHHQQGLELCRKVGYLRGEVDALTGLARTQRALGHLSEAFEHAVEAVTAAERGQLRVRQVPALAELAEIHRAMGDEEEAERARCEAVELARVTGRRAWELKLAQPPANGGSTSS
ncbi:AfsR/SARP family transcriptional regulator [Lentzea nigeriaca]|uniref:AfsR/SARP family transcriptional regulator n=1 Tax=Lentzea nigeriaca TaxID=1128665 RepID=UPI00195DA118|nr:tetratricopeptide repeat protein [Lentzea nigeriaca]MBM7858150.1 tetratricopeptide (TPR) repeat protein [Lentzea nigeriaca]